MAENNIQVVIPAQNTVDDLVAVLTEAFAEASGMTADENNTFWITQDVLGVRVKAYTTTNVGIYVVDYSGAETVLTTYAAYTAENCFIYNKSMGGSVFAFGLWVNTASDKLLRAAIAQDTAGVTRVIMCGSSAWDLYSPNASKQSVNASTNKAASFEFATLIKLPAVHARATFSELYQVYSMPNSSFGTDSSLYVSGGLYKTLSYSSNTLALAFRVA